MSNMTTTGNEYADQFLIMTVYHNNGSSSCGGGGGGGGETGLMYLKSPVMHFPSVRLSLIFLRAEYKICTYYIYILYIYISAILD